MSPRNRAFALLELAVSMVIIGALAALVAQAMVLSTRTRTEHARRAAALVEAGNVMEQLIDRPWNDLEPGSDLSVELSSEARRALPGVTAEVTIENEPDEPAATANKRITAAVSWDSITSGIRQRVTLAAWKQEP